jgi:hypothetical protein
MKNLLAPAAIALAIGASSVPAKAHVVEEVTYHDKNNTIILATKKENTASEAFKATGGQADNRLRPAEIYFCQGGPGSTVSDLLVISVRSPVAATKQPPNPVGSVFLELLSDPFVNIVGTCQTAGKSDGIPVYFVDERTCKGRCEVGRFFGLDDDAVTVLSK